MKEYICKEDLIKTISEYEIYGNKDFLEDLFGAILSNSTVTKADIVNDFVNHYMKDYLDCNKCNRDDDFCCIKCFRDKYLAEMESEE